MKTKIRTPFLEIGIKNYLYGNDVLKLAKTADKAAIKYDVDVLFIAPYADIRMVSENTERLIVFAPYMDALRPGRGVADVLPESLKAAGAKGVMLNHSERPMSIAKLRETIERANELELLSFVCSDTIAETMAVAHLHPDIINPEPSELIGTGNVSDMSYVATSIKAVKDVYPDILVEQAAGIRTGQQVFDNIMLGADGVGAASGICTSENPLKTAEEMIYYTYLAKQELINKK